MFGTFATHIYIYEVFTKANVDIQFTVQYKHMYEATLTDWQTQFTVQYKHM